MKTLFANTHTHTHGTQTVKRDSNHSNYPCTYQMCVAINTYIFAAVKKSFGLICKHNNLSCWLQLIVDKLDGINS